MSRTGDVEDVTHISTTVNEFGARRLDVRHDQKQPLS